MGDSTVKRHPDPEVCECKRCSRTLGCEYCDEKYSYSERREYYEHLENTHIDELTIEDRGKLSRSRYVDYRKPSTISRLEAILALIGFIIMALVFKWALRENGLIEDMREASVYLLEGVFSSPYILTIFSSVFA